MGRLLTAISIDDAVQLVEKNNINYSELNQNLDKELVGNIQEFIRDNTGFETGFIACVQKIEGANVNLEEHYDEIANYFQVATGTIVLEMKVDEDLEISMKFEDLLEFNKRFKNADDKIKNFLKKELHDSLIVGEIENEEDVVTFLPFVDINKCTYFIMLTEDWEAGNFELGNVPQIKLKRLDINDNSNI